MIKYFIEDSKGRWLTDPEESGPSWTKDPSKAWGFDEQVPPQYGMNDLVKDGFLIIDMRGKLMSSIIDFLVDEGKCTGLLTRKHEWFEMSNGEKYYIKRQNPVHWITYTEHNLMIKAGEEISKQLGRRLFYT